MNINLVEMYEDIYKGKKNVPFTCCVIIVSVVVIFRTFPPG